MIIEPLNNTADQTNNVEPGNTHATVSAAEFNTTDAHSSIEQGPPKNHKRKATKSLVVAGVLLVAAGATGHFFKIKDAATASTAPTTVAVSIPLQRDIESQLQALGQFSAVERVELRPQVGGILTEIGFKDGNIVKKGDLLFAIDATPYEIKLAQATALRESAKAKLDLAERQLKRAKILIVSGAGTIENTDQRVADEQAARALVDDADAQVRDAQFDLDHTRITAPFTGRIGSHQVSVGNLVAGSRAATSPTTLLTTIVSLNPIYLDFDMSESDYVSFQHIHSKQSGTLSDKVAIALNGGSEFSQQGTLDFIDNTLNRSSGTIHARATVSNDNFQITPGAFGRVKASISAATPTLMVPDAAVIPDQSQFLVYTVGEGGIVTPKIVEVGELQNGLRVIYSGLTPTDKVIVDSIPRIHPGTKVTPELRTIVSEKLTTKTGASTNQVAFNNR